VFYCSILFSCDDDDDDFSLPSGDLAETFVPNDRLGSEVEFRKPLFAVAGRPADARYAFCTVEMMYSRDEM
jgi:hypothetical protein